MEKRTSPGIDIANSSLLSILHPKGHFLTTYYQTFHSGFGKPAAAFSPDSPWERSFTPQRTQFVTAHARTSFGEPRM